MPATQEGVKIAVTDNELRNRSNSHKSSGDNDAAATCERILRELPAPASLAVTSTCYLLTLKLFVHELDDNPCSTCL